VPSIGAAERDAVIEVLESGWLTTGQKTVAFEEAVRARLGCGHAVAVNSATAALHLILEALGIRAGDEVVVPTYTFAACGETVRYLDARPRLADVDPNTFCATAETIEAQLRPETKAIMVVHFAGRLADMEPILELARGRNLPVIEDAAHALPCSRDDHEAGTIGTAGALSFYATKTVTTGEGGMLVTESDEIANRARSMRLHGLTRDAWKRYSGSGSWYYEIEDVGFKYNLTDLAAASGWPGDTWRRSRRPASAISSSYRRCLGPTRSTPGTSIRSGSISSASSRAEPKRSIVWPKPASAPASTSFRSICTRITGARTATSRATCRWRTFSTSGRFRCRSIRT
jgi:perosamine synthetase